MVDGFFAWWLWVLFRLEDPPAPQGWPVVACLAACMGAVAASWRWPRSGGWATLIGAAALAGAVTYSSLVTGLGLAGLAMAVIYPAPFAVAGSLALMDAGFRQARPERGGKEGGGA
jgi:hypothetical protein